VLQLPPHIAGALGLSVDGKSLTLTVSAVTQPLKWTAAVNNIWDINNTTNWVDSAASPAKYLENALAGGIAGDHVVFDDTALPASPVSVTLTTVNPASVTVSNETKNYVFQSAAITGAGILTKAGAGTLTLNFANTYTGDTTVNGGTLKYGVANALAAGGVKVNGGTLDLDTRAGAVGQVTLAAGSIIGGAGGILTGTGYMMSNAVAGAVSAILAGAAPLTKNGAGTLTLSGANTYTGGTTINAGVLLVANASGSGTGAGAVTLKSGAILGGTGRVAGMTTVESGGHLAPGMNSIGTLTFAGSNLNFNSGAVLDCEIGGTDTSPACDLVNLTAANSTITFGNSATLNVARADGATLSNPTGKTFVLFDYNGTDPTLPPWSINRGTTGWSGGKVSVDTVNKRIVLTGLIPSPTGEVLLLR